MTETPRAYTACWWRRNRTDYFEGFTTREEAAMALFTRWPKAETCSTGYGYHGCFDVLWHKRADIMTGAAA